MTARSKGERRRRALVWLLRLFGGASLLAIVAVVMPVEWIHGAHRRLGMGNFPDESIAVYLARSLSLFYALVGGLQLVLASDPDRYRPLIVYAGWGSAVAGLFMLWIELAVGLPAWWSYHAGPSASLYGAALILLARRPFSEGG